MTKQAIIKKNLSKYWLFSSMAVITTLGIFTEFDNNSAAADDSKGSMSGVSKNIKPRVHLEKQSVSLSERQTNNNATDSEKKTNLIDHVANTDATKATTSRQMQGTNESETNKVAQKTNDDTDNTESNAESKTISNASETENKSDHNNNMVDSASDPNGGSSESQTSVNKLDNSTMVKKEKTSSISVSGSSRTEPVSKTSKVVKQKSTGPKIQASTTDLGSDDLDWSYVPIDEWMPDKNLQNQVAQQLGKNVEDVTKQDVRNADLYLIESFVGEDDITNLSGLEYAKGFGLTLIPKRDIDTNDIIRLFDGKKYKNLGGVGWYGNAEYCSQVNLAIFLELLPANSEFTMTGSMAYPIQMSLSKDQYSNGGILRVPLREIGIWNTNEYQLYKADADSWKIKDFQHGEGIEDIVFKDQEGNILATYVYQRFDVKAQTFLFEFDQAHSETVEKLAGKKMRINYGPSTFSQNNYFYVNTWYDKQGGSDLFRPEKIAQSHIIYWFDEILFSNEGHVTVKYVDDQRNPISEDEQLTGDIGTNYTTKPKTITGYTYKTIEGSATGVFTDDDQTITYVYTKNDSGGTVTPTPETETPTPETETPTPETETPTPEKESRPKPNDTIRPEAGKYMPYHRSVERPNRMQISDKKQGSRMEKTNNLDATGMTRKQTHQSTTLPQTNSKRSVAMSVIGLIGLSLSISAIVLRKRQ